MDWPEIMPKFLEETWIAVMYWGDVGDGRSVGVLEQNLVVENSAAGDDRPEWGWVVGKSGLGGCVGSA